MSQLTAYVQMHHNIAQHDIASYIVTDLTVYTYISKQSMTWM